MDLPTCPACNQSVLDDDAVECPFCGAAMDGSSPAKKSVAPAKQDRHEPAAEQSPTTQSAAKSKPVSTSRTQSNLQDDDADPFAVETSTVSSKLPRARRKPARGVMHRVVCPMCETQGFVPKKMAGEEIRCANPKCLVPVFTIPALPKKEEPEEEPASTFPAWLMILLLIVAVGGAGGGIWFFVLRPEPTTPGVDPNMQLTNTDKNNNQNQTDQKNNNDSNGTDNPNTPEKTQVPEFPALTIQEQREKILSQIVAESQSRRANRSKPFCRRLASETYALANDITGAEDQLKQLNELSNALPYYNIQPLVQIAWQQIQNDQESEAAQKVRKADQLGSTLPKFGRGAVDAATALAAALSANNELPRARSLLSAHQKTDDTALLSAQMHIIICLLDHYRDVAVIQARIDSLLSTRLPAEGGLLQEWLAPQQVAVAADLFIHQQYDALQKWIAVDTNPQHQTQSLLACIDLLPSTNNKTPMGQIIALAKTLPPAGQATVLARLATHQKSKEPSAESDKLFGQARELLSKPANAQVFQLGDAKNFKTVLDLKLPNAIQARLIAVSFLECARAANIHQDQKTAVNMLQSALQHARSIAPSIPEIQSRLQTMRSIGERGMLQQIKAQLNLNLDAQARTTYRQYKKRCDELLELANSRRQLESEILMSASLWGLQQHVWEEIQQRESDTNISLKANFDKSNVMHVLATQFESANQGDLAKTIRDRSKTKADLLSDQYVKLTNDLTATPLEQLPAKFENQRLALTTRYRWALLLTNQICRDKKWPESTKYIRSLNNPIWKEDCLRLAASIYAHAGQREQVLHHLENDNLNPTEAVSVYRGLIVGLDSK